MENLSFTLRRLEMAMPLMEMAEKKDPKAFAQLAALAMADDATLRLASAGNKEAMQVFLDKAYDMPSEEAASVLSFFTRESERFTLVVTGLSPEEVNQAMAIRDKKIRVAQGLVLPEGSQA